MATDFVRHALPPSSPARVALSPSKTRHLAAHNSQRLCPTRAAVLPGPQRKGELHLPARPPFPASSSSRFLFLARLPAVSFLRPHTPLCPISRLLPQFWPSSLGPRLCELAGPDCLHCIKRKKSISGSQRFLLSRTSSDFVHPNDIANLPSDQTNHPQSAVPHISIRHLPALYVRSSRWPLPDHRDLPTRHSGQAKVSL